jgi:hypothetical protein
LSEVCSDTSTTKIRKLVSNTEQLIKLIPGVCGVKVMVKDTSCGGISGEVLYGNPEVSGFALEFEPSSDRTDEYDRKAPEASIYNFDCFEIVGNFPLIKKINKYRKL